MSILPTHSDDSFSLSPVVSHDFGHDTPVTTSIGRRKPNESAEIFGPNTNSFLGAKYIIIIRIPFKNRFSDTRLAFIDACLALNDNWHLPDMLFIFARWHRWCFRLTSCTCSKRDMNAVDELGPRPSRTAKSTAYCSAQQCTSQ